MLNFYFHVQVKNMEFKDRLKQIIDRLGISITDLLEKCHISKSQFYNYSNGTQEPSSKFLKNLKKLNPSVNIDWLLTGIGDPFIERPKAKYKVLRDIIKMSYKGENEDLVFSMLERDDFSFFEKNIFLCTIMTFLKKAEWHTRYSRMLIRYASVMTKENVGIECDESRSAIMDTLTDKEIIRTNRLFEIAQYGFENNQPGLVFFFTKIFDYLEAWDFNPETMKFKIKLFDEDFVIYDPFTPVE